MDFLVDVLKGLEEEVRGLGRVYLYEEGHLSAYFVPAAEDVSFNSNRLLSSFYRAVGPPDIVITLVPGERIELYPTGNVTDKNPLLHPSFSPRSVSPVDPHVLGTLWLLLRRAGSRPALVAVHDPPSNLNAPHIRIALPRFNIVPYILAALRRPRLFVPVITVSRAYEASYFYPLFEKRHISAYHVPYYWAHHLPFVLDQLMEKGRARRLLVERGLVLPGELPHEEV